MVRTMTEIMANVVMPEMVGKVKRRRRVCRFNGSVRISDICGDAHVQLRESKVVGPVGSIQYQLSVAMDNVRLGGQAGEGVVMKCVRYLMCELSMILYSDSGMVVIVPKSGLQCESFGLLEGGSVKLMDYIMIDETRVFASRVKLVSPLTA